MQDEYIFLPAWASCLLSNVIITRRRNINMYAIAPGRQYLRATCPKGELERKFFFQALSYIK